MKRSELVHWYWGFGVVRVEGLRLSGLRVVRVEGLGKQSTCNDTVRVAMHVPDGGWKHGQYEHGCDRMQPLGARCEPELSSAATCAPEPGPLIAWASLDTVVFCVLVSNESGELFCGYAGEPEALIRASSK